MSGKQAPLIIAQEEGVDYVPGQLVDAKVETGDIGRAAFNLAQVDTPTAGLWDTVKAAYLDTEGEQVSPEELNQKYGLQDTFKVPMTEAAAAVIAERANIRKQSEEVLSRAEQGLINSTVSFGASIAANMIDPLNLAADIAVGKGFGMIAKSGKIAMMTNWGAHGASSLRRFGEAAVEGALGNLAVEPLVFGGRSLENKDRALDEIAMETIAGALAFPAVKLVGGEVLSRGLKFWNGLDTRSASNLYRSAKAQLMSGKKINVEPLTREQVKMTSEFSVPEGKALFGNKTGYEYNPKASVSANDSFYVSVTNHVDTLEDARFGTFSDDYGGQVKLTDNAFAANGAAARLTADSTGKVFEVTVDPSAKLLNLENRFDALDVESQKAVLDAYKAATGVELKNPESMTVKEIHDALHEGIMNDNYKTDVVSDFNKKIQEAGYDGYIHNGSKLAEMDHNPHNVLDLFNSDKLEIRNAHEASRDFVKSLTLEERKDILQKSLANDEPGFWEDNKTAKQIDQELKDEGLSYDQKVDPEEFHGLDPEKVDQDIEAAYKNENITEAEYKEFKELNKTKKQLDEAEARMYECLYGVSSK